MIRILFDPKIFNWILFSLYVAGAVRWGFARSWMDALYWVGAALLTLAITLK